MERVVRQRLLLVWGVLLTAFTVCVVLAIAVPVGVNIFIDRARRPLLLYAQAGQGTLVRDNGNPLSVADPPTEVNAPLTLTTNTLTDDGFVQVYHPGPTPDFLGRVRLYGNTRVRLERADFPRFARSDETPRLQMALERGRLRLTLAPPAGRAPTAVVLQTAEGELWLEPGGDYAVQRSGRETQLSVLEGQARLRGATGELILSADQRGVLDAAGAATGPFGAERNLVQNGEFTNRTDKWILTSWSVERSDQPAGETLIVDSNGETALRFRRFGVGNARNEVRQIVEQDIAGFSELRLDVSLRIWSQSLPVCGSLGSECPLTVRVEFDDAQGRTLAYQQGFYAVGDPSETAPPFCASCGAPLRLSTHRPVNQLAELFVYESENWLPRLEQDGFRPTRIRSVSLIAEGHSFEVDVVQVALLAQE